MYKVKLVTRIDERLFSMARSRASEEGLNGAGGVIEEALKLYFSFDSVQVWEKQLEGGWMNKIIVRPGKITLESIRSRKIISVNDPRYYSDSALMDKGWKRVWKLKDKRAV